LRLLVDHTFFKLFKGVYYLKEIAMVEEKAEISALTLLDNGFNRE
jgi:hypothetical protein